MFVLVALSALAIGASALVAARARFESRAEFLLATTLLWNLLILVPIHVLGLLNHLTAPILCGVSSFFFLCVGAFSFVGTTSPAAHASEAVESLLGALTLPFAAVSETLRARSFALVGIVASFVVIAWTIWLSYLMPSDSWDGLWYHEVTIGFTVQNHGYAPIGLPVLTWYPASMIQQANGYPRNCEMTNLWFVIFAGRDLVEVVNSFAAIPMMLATYVMARRYSKDRSAAIGFASAIALMPAIVSQYRTTYMDVHAAALYLGAFHFCTKPRLRIADGALGMVGLSLVIGAKSMFLATAPVLWLALAVALVHGHFRARRGATLAVLIGGTTLVVAMAAVCYVRNWIVFGGPLYPIALDIPRLGIHLYGLNTPDAILADEGKLALPDIVARILQFRAPGRDFADAGSWAYGTGVAFFLFPLGIVLTGLLAVDVGALALHERLYRDPSVPRSEHSRRTWNAALVTSIFVVFAVTSPKLWAPRYNFPLVVGFMLVVAWFSSRAPRLADSVSSLIVAANLVFLHYWSPGWGVTFEGAQKYAKMTHAERDANSASEWSITPEVARARDRELGRDDVVAVSAETTFIFITQLWNERLTNKVVYVNPTSVDAFLAGADSLHAKWVVVGEGAAIATELNRRKDQWQAIGLASRGYPQVAYRRLK